MTLTDIFVSPFTDYLFMRRALAAALLLSIGGAPLGVFMVLRRMTLVGDALSHAILPGVAVAFLAAGLSVWAMSVGGLIAAICVAMAVALLVKLTQLKEDAAFALLYLLSLAVGVTLLSVKGSGVNLLHLLFGNILAIDAPTLKMVLGASCLSVFGVAAAYRRFVIHGFDPDFMAVAGKRRWGSAWVNPLFFILLMVNLLAAFQALGTLMALGLLLLPALAARFWVWNIDALMPLAIFIAGGSAYAGLLLSYHAGAPSGPAIVLVAGGVTLVSALVGRIGSVRCYLKESF